MVNRRKEKQLYYLKNKDRILKQSKNYHSKNKILVCKKARDKWIKIKDKWNKKRREYYLKNKKIIDKKHKEYRIKNIITIKEKEKLYYIKNKDKIKKQYDKNKDKIIKRIVIYIKEKRKNNLSFRILCNLRRRVGLALKGNPKLQTSLKLVGCSIDKLKKHLESKFKDGMSWDNYGKWHIDHIKPCASFNLIKPSEQRKCFHYTNLQPLWAEENLRKSSKI